MVGSVAALEALLTSVAIPVLFLAILVGDERALPSVLLFEFALQLGLPAVALVLQIRLSHRALRLLDLDLAEAFHARLALCLELSGREPRLTGLFHHAEPDHPILLLLFDCLLGQNSKACPALLDALFSQFFRHNAEALGSLHLLALLLFDQLKGLNRRRCLLHAWNRSFPDPKACLS